MKCTFYVPLIILLTSTLWLASCHCSCNCERNLGCRIMTARRTDDKSILVIKKFCSSTNYDSDLSVRDSSFVFIQQYQSDSTFVETRDSIFHYQKVGKLSCDAAERYKTRGFGCSCSK